MTKINTNDWENVDEPNIKRQKKRKKRKQMMENKKKIRKIKSGF
tara:strand:+ start:355 stop:486 length:132 start_codon:yes stop_codon:yes gene_type:complete